MYIIFVNNMVTIISNNELINHARKRYNMSISQCLCSRIPDDCEIKSCFIIITNKNMCLNATISQFNI